MRARQRGVSILFVAIVLIAIAAGSLAFLALTRTSTGVDRSTETAARLAKVAAALEQFASASERLPCPADPALDTGDAVPNAAATVCTHNAGTVPWRSIGLRREDALDTWGFKISYRVYSGATGLTQAGGASMVHCDTVEPSPAGTTAAGLCNSATHNTSEAQFLAGKGLTVSDFGAGTTGVAFLVISHGPTGQGAYTSAGIAKTPSPASVDELANLGAAGPFVAKAAVTGVSSETGNTHFDDVLLYRRLADFVKRANLSARDWPEATMASLTFNTATLTAALGSAPASDTGQQTINFPNATVTAFGSGGNQNISFGSAGGTEGIGGVGGGNSLLSSAAGEGVRIDFASKARQVAVTFAHFGRRPGNVREQAEFRFYDGPSVITTIVGEGCHNDGGLATFTFDALADFDRVEIKAIPATNDASASEFLFAQLLSCAAGAPCKTSLSAASNLCS